MPAPSGPTWRTSPSASRTGRARSTAALSPPHQQQQASRAGGRDAPQDGGLDEGRTRLGRGLGHLHVHLVAGGGDVDVDPVAARLEGAMVPR